MMAGKTSKSGSPVKVTFIRVHTHAGKRYLVGDQAELSRREIEKLLKLDVIKAPDQDG